MSRGTIRRFWSEDRGFTLPELVIAVVIMGILAGVAVPTWWRLTEGRRVNAATNQVVADLRLAHGSATNRLNDYMVSENPCAALGLPVATCASGDYFVVEIRSPITSSIVTRRDLPDTTDVAAFGFRFKPDGSAQLVGGSPTTFGVGPESNISSGNSVNVNTATSRIRAS